MVAGRTSVKSYLYGVEVFVVIGYIIEKNVRWSEIAMRIKEKIQIP